MRLNERARKAIADDLPGEQIVAIVQMVTQHAVSHSTQTGNVLGKSILGTPYFVERDLNFSHPKCLHLLHDAWLTVTDRRLVFSKAKALGIRPKPGDQIQEAALGTSTLHWWDQGKRWRVIHLEFDDGSWLGQVTDRGSGRKPLAEPDLLVEAWGDRAVEVTDAPQS